MFSNDNLFGSDCFEVVFGFKMINNIMVFDFWIVIFVYCEFIVICYSLKKCLWIRKEGRIICNESVMRNKNV